MKKKLSKKNITSSKKKAIVFAAEKKCWKSPPQEVENVFEEIKKRGANKAVLKYQGGGEEGCCYEANLYKGKKLVEELDSFNHKDPFIGLLTQPIWERYGNFDWFERVNGILTWNATKKSFQWSGNCEPVNNKNS